MLKEYNSSELPFDVFEAQLIYAESVDFHLKVECGFLLVGTTLLIQNGEERRYFELTDGQWDQPIACCYLEACNAHEAGELPAELDHLFEDRPSLSGFEAAMTEALSEMLTAMYSSMDPFEMMIAAAMGDPIAQAILSKLASEAEETPPADDGPPSGFASFFAS